MTTTDVPATAPIRRDGIHYAIDWREGQVWRAAGGIQGSEGTGRWADLGDSPSK